MLHFFSRGGRVLSLVLFAALGATLLMRYAPGYLADSRELDAAHAEQVRAQLSQLQSDQATLPRLLGRQCNAWLHGNLGQSRLYSVPVTDLLQERYGPTVRLLTAGVASGWFLASALALPLSMRRRSRGDLLVMAATATFMAVPVGVLATSFLLLNKGGPVLTLSLLVAVREFKLLYGLLAVAWRAPHLFYARAQGFSQLHSLRVHIASVLRPELLNLFGMSAIVALSALVPVEVIFDVPGLGQLAWAAAINRDLPVLVAMTALMAVCVGCVSLILTQGDVERSTLCE